MNTVKHIFSNINTAVLLAKAGRSKELSILLSQKPHLINEKNINGNTLLHIACWKGFEDMVLMLLMRGGDINAIDGKGYTPLLVAIEFCRVSIAKILLDRGASTNITNQAMCLPLHVAALSGCQGIIIPLLERGADINAIEVVSIPYFYRLKCSESSKES
jgi:ankyrin repeat protein